MSRLFHPKILDGPADKSLTLKLAEGHKGIIKIVTNVKNGDMAAGAKWHSELRDMFIDNGSESDYLWGAKLFIADGHIEFTSQINEGRAEVSELEIVDAKLRARVEELIHKFFKVVFTT